MTQANEDKAKAIRDWLDGVVDIDPHKSYHIYECILGDLNDLEARLTICSHCGATNIPKDLRIENMALTTLVKEKDEEIANWEFLSGSTNGDVRYASVFIKEKEEEIIRLKKEIADGRKGCNK